MADISQSNWSETDSANNAASPNGWTSATMLPSQVEPTARAEMGALKRFWNRINGTLTSGGSANVQTLSYSIAPPAYVTGEVYRFIAGFTNAGATTLNVNALGAKAVQWHGAALVGNEIVIGRISEVIYDGTQFELINSQTEVSSASLAASATTDTTNAANITSGTLPVARLNGLNQIGAALGADVLLNNTAAFFDGPSIAQGVTGNWFVIGQVTLVDTNNPADFLVKLWDGSNVVASTKVSTPAVNAFSTVTLAGFLTSPAGNLRVSVRDLTTTAGAIKFNASGSSRDSYIVAFRVA